ncbi:hypothetical protein, partial [Aestuariivita sp.]|uniref:hypothetical protein n=1 Tax=Aestuariivita sp. TaxID=1872407 RepID=UPI0025C265BA
QWVLTLGADSWPIGSNATEPLNATAAALSITIMTPHVVARIGSTMMQNATSKPGHHRWNSLASC